MSTYDYSRLDNDPQAEAFAVILSVCFGPSLEDARGWVDRGGREHVRLLSSGERVAGGLFVIPMGQWWGERSVPMVGIGGVAVDPGDRASGGATRLMQEVVRELHDEGVALSTLYPATQPLYRRAGYEQAGGHWAIRVSTQRLAARDRTLTLRRAEPSDDEDIARLHRDHGRENPGTVERSEQSWQFVRDPHPGPVHAFVVEGKRGLEGYVYYQTRGNAANHQDLFVNDLVARTPAAARRLLTFFRDHRTLVDTVRWRGNPADPLLLQAREQRHEIRLWDVWMLRIVDVARALSARGYPAGVEAELHLDLADDVLAGNAGRWVLRVAGGGGRVEPGGEGRIRLDVRTLAPLYSGFASPWQLRTGHDLVCDDEEAARLGAVFAGPMPWMQDGF